MPGSSNNSSFIPKRGTTKQKRKVRKGGIYVLSILSSVALFTALAASATVYFYGGTVERELQAEMSAISAATSNFKEADLRRVKDFDLRIDQASQRLNSSVSIVSIFEAIESATAKTVRFDSFRLERNADENFIVEASIFTDNFDSTIFQRGIYSDSNVIERIEIADVTLEQGERNSEDTTVSFSEPVSEGVAFEVFFSIPISAVPYKPDAMNEFTTEADVPTVDVEIEGNENEEEAVEVSDEAVDTEGSSEQAETAEENTNQTNP